ncbi:MAG: outer membrane beta-barrel protein [Elusimicrobiota bacterium]|nr:outer membrane beta-barrel protein [Elusimicrobiota bacterium]
MRPMIRVIAVLPVLLASSAQAVSLDWLTQYKKPNIHWGQLALHPHYRLTEVYDSNIYLVPRDQPNNVIVGGGVRGSWITKNELGLELELPWRKLHNLTAGYVAESHNYTTDASANDTVNQAAHVDYAYAGAYGLTFRAGDRYLNTRDQAFSQLVSRDRRWSNTAYAGLDYDQKNGNMAGGVDASHTVNKYLGDAIGRQLNRYSQRFGFNVGYKVQPQTKVYASYHRGITHYSVGRAVGEQDKNSKSHDFGLGVAGVVAPKVTGRAEAGLSYREYDEAPLGGVTRVTRNMTVTTDLTWKPQDRTDVILTLSRGLQESISASNRFYISNSAILDVKHRLPRKFSVGLNAAFGLDKYPDTQFIGTTGARGDRRDDIYQGGAWIEYDIQAWLSTGLSHVYRERNSTFTSQFNYEDHQTAWNLALKF